MKNLIKNLFKKQLKKNKNQESLHDAEIKVYESAKNFINVSGIKLDNEGKLVLSKDGYPAPKHNPIYVKNIMDEMNNLGGGNMDVKKSILGDEMIEKLNSLKNFYDKWTKEESAVTKNKIERDMSVIVDFIVNSSRT